MWIGGVLYAQPGQAARFFRGTILNYTGKIWVVGTVCSPLPSRMKNVDMNIWSSRNVVSSRPATKIPRRSIILRHLEINCFKSIVVTSDWYSVVPVTSSICQNDDAFPVQPTKHTTRAQLGYDSCSILHGSCQKERNITHRHQTGKHRELDR